MTAGLRTTCGSRMLANFASPYDARVIENFDAAGTHLASYRVTHSLPLFDAGAAEFAWPEPR